MNLISNAVVSRKNQWPEFIIELKSYYTISKDEVIVVGIEILKKDFMLSLGTCNVFTTLANCNCGKYDLCPNVLPTELPFK